MTAFQVCLGMCIVFVVALIIMLVIMSVAFLCKMRKERE